MDTLQAIIIAILQGATELFPVSSLGHAVVLPALLHWNVDQRAHEFLPFLVMLHFGTSAALLAYFWRDWWMLGTGVLGIGGTHQVKESRRVFMLVRVAAVRKGWIFHHNISIIDTQVFSIFHLIITGIVYQLCSCLYFSLAWSTTFTR